MTARIIGLIVGAMALAIGIFITPPAGSDGEGAQRQLDRIAKGWRLKRVAQPLIVNTASQTPEEILSEKTVDPKELGKCRELGSALAEGLRQGVF